MVNMDGNIMGMRVKEKRKKILIFVIIERLSMSINWFRVMEIKRTKDRWLEK